MISEHYARKFCRDDLSLIENYALAIADTTQTWICHHILGEQYSTHYLKENGLYLKRPACELRFMTRAEHNALHKQGVQRSEETKKAISDTQKGVPKSEAHKQAISDGKKGVPIGPMSEEHKKALSDAKKGVPQPWNYKRVLQYSKSGDLINEWESIGSAAKALYIAYTHISDVCRYKRKSAGGFIWRYA